MTIVETLTDRQLIEEWVNFHKRVKNKQESYYKNTSRFSRICKGVYHSMYIYGYCYWFNYPKYRYYKQIEAYLRGANRSNYNNNINK